jgi:TRAP-type C4-dicarboxylate transport system permease small subunit
MAQGQAVSYDGQRQLRSRLMSERGEVPFNTVDSFAKILFVRAPYCLIGALFIIAALINIANVIGRYVFSAPIFWAEEVLVFIVVWSVFLAAISITYQGAHLSMDLVYANLPTRWKRVVNCLIAATFIGCTSFVAVQSFRALTVTLQTRQVSVGAEIPLAIPQSAVLFGFGCMTLAIALRLKGYLTGKFD